MRELISQTPAYKIIQADKRADTLSHAYLLVCQDQVMHEAYLKVLAKLMLCDKSEDFCDNCRVCKLIDSLSHPDVFYYPKDGKLSSEHADEIVRQSVIRPFEIAKKLFIINQFEKLSQSQNKLLKTLEEPPKNTHILLSSLRPTAVLPTIKSRSKIIEIPPFSRKQLGDFALRQGFFGEKLELSLSLADGKVGQLLRYYETDELLDLRELALDILSDMTAKNLPSFASRLKDVNIPDFIGILKLQLSNVLSLLAGGDHAASEKLINITQKSRYGSIIGIIERLNALEKSQNFNLNGTMLVDGILFAVMEEKSKWQKL